MNLNKQLKAFKRDLLYCTYCPKMCRFACPVGNAEYKETVTPWGKMSLLNFLKEGLTPLTKETAAVLYKCLNCRLCTTYCEHKVPVEKILNIGKSMVAEKYEMPDPVRELRQHFDIFKTVFKENLAGQVKIMAGDLGFPLFNRKASPKKTDVFYFPGCNTIKYREGLIKSTLRLFKHFKIPTVEIISDPVCCGYPLLQAGLVEDFKKQAQSVAAALKNCHLVVSSCPTCVYTLKEIYKEYGLEVQSECRHALEYFAPLLPKHIPAPDSKTVFYHDPCFLGRYLNIYDLPREILSCIFRKKITEFTWNRESSYCCGGSGIYNEIFPDIAQKIAAERVEELQQAGPNSLIITACPKCEKMLGNQGEIEVYDIIEYIAQGVL